MNPSPEYSKYLWIPLVLSFVACSTTAPSTQKLSVSATPENASIYIDNKLAGIGTGRMEVRPKNGADVKIVAPGHHPHEQHIHGTLSKEGTTDLLVGAACCAFAFAGLLTDGATTLTQNELHVDLIPLADTAPAP